MIEIKHLSKTFQMKDGAVNALKNIDLTIPDGSIYGIIGMSGAGKSTLIRTINRMHDITNGTLTVDGTDVMQLHGKSLRAFRRRIGMIFQSFNLVTRTTVIKNVLTAFVPELPWWRAALGIFTKAEKTAALEALDKVGILDKAFVRADQLSGGQQQRVALARTLAQNPQIILADEPVASLDPVTAKQVMDDFQRINRDMRITILINIQICDLCSTFFFQILAGMQDSMMLNLSCDNVISLGFICFISSFQCPVIRLGTTCGKVDVVRICSDDRCYFFSSFCYGFFADSCQFIYAGRIAIVLRKIREHRLYYFRCNFCGCRIIQINNFLHDDFASYP